MIDRITPTRRPGVPAVMYQEWRHLLFLHWAVPPAVIQDNLPPGLTVDTFDGNAYIGLVPFTMRNVRPVWSPPVQGLSHFHETNVRTYVHRSGKEPGVWFFSLDAANPVAVQIARTFWKLPYFFAEMSLHREGETLCYASRRLYPAPVPARSEVRAIPTGTATASLPGTLEFFLAERYILYAYKGGRLYSGRVHHDPYPLQPATVVTLETDLLEVAGFPLPNDALCPDVPLAHYAAGVTVEVFPLSSTAPYNVLP